MTPEIYYYVNGGKHLEIYYKLGKLHRLDGPAYIGYYRSGKIYSETYFIKGKKHRLNGPAAILYNQNGECYIEEYWFNGNEITQKEYENLLEQCDNDFNLLKDLLTIRYS